MVGIRFAAVSHDFVLTSSGVDTEADTGQHSRRRDGRKRVTDHVQGESGKKVKMSCRRRLKSKDSNNLYRRGTAGLYPDAHISLDGCK